MNSTSGPPRFAADANGNIVMGDQASPITTGIGNTIAGSLAGQNTDTGNSNTFFGYKAGQNVKGNGGNGNLVGALLVAIGSEALGNCTTGYSNVAVGQKALNALTTTSGNVGIGKSAGAGVTGSRNVVIGHGAGEFAGASDDSIRIGYGAAGSIVASQGVYIGTGAGGASTAGGLVAIGYSAGNSLLSGGAGDSVLVGNLAGYSLTSGGQSTFVGRSAGLGVTTANGNVCLGAYAGYTSSGGAHSIIIGRQAIGEDLSNAFIAGSSQVAANAAAIRDVYIGNGATATTPLSTTYHGTGGSGSNVAGADHIIAGGKGTGTGAGGKVALAVAPAGSTGSTANALVNFVELLSDGYVFVKDASTVPGSNPSGGGYLYSEGGALKWRGSSGTITTIAVA